ncbi:TerB family tellurite resistance protein [Tundrisphaera sp. TA3]|uniref:TerB family tellurite resistance protein n=1 Tax=Tundrisphaera sp. TA3 TaxID=3435775 RepID=UPI003EBFE448
MFAALGKAISKAKEKFEALVNEEELKAVVAASVLVAAADGNISEAEKEAAFKAITSHESLRGFNQKAIRSHFDSDVNLINADKQLAEEVLYDKVSVIRDKIARIRVIGIATQIANADGDFSKSEKDVVDKIRRMTA